MKYVSQTIKQFAQNIEENSHEGLFCNKQEEK